MRTGERRFTQRLLAIASLAILPAFAAFADPPTIEIQVAPEVLKAPFSGKLYVLTTTRAGRDPMHGPGWFNPPPFFAWDVRGVENGQTFTLDPGQAAGHPMPLVDLPAGRRGFQAVLSVNDWDRSVTTGPGNAHSQTVFIEHDPENPGRVKLEIAKTVREPEFNDTERVRYVRLKSTLLSSFHKRDVYLQAAVGLPEGYHEEAGRRYPTMYEIPGFGGNLRMARWMLGRNEYGAAGLDLVHVFLDPECPLGHHVFADSANNGPWGAALTTELIPHLEKTFRLIPETGARYLTGHSSGGWSSLWLQVAYPDVFGGTWSTSPDPVDFHAFQLVDIYADGANMYEQDGAPIAVSRPSARGQIFTRAMSHMEDTLGRGGQLQSFEAVFSPRGADGQPKKLWDRKTGAVDPQVARAWEAYDIALVLERNWSLLGPKLKGKLHIICGDADTFWLERAVLRLRDTLERLGSDASVVMIPGADHGLPPTVQQQIAREVAAAFAAYQAGE